MDRIRVASLQYYIRPVPSFEAFRDQVEGLVDRQGESRDGVGGEGSAVPPSSQLRAIARRSPAGNRTQNAVPRPGSLVTEI